MRSSTPAPGTEPSLRQIMLRPKWLAALAGVLAMAALFAGLAQWQLTNALQGSTAETVTTETPRELAELNPAGTPVSDTAAGHLATVTIRYVPGDWRIITDRVNESRVGYWVVAHGRAHSESGGNAAEANLAVALGWTADPHTALRAIQQLDALATGNLGGQEVTGRYNPTEAPKPPRPLPEGDQQAFATLAPAQLINDWQAELTGPNYAGYLVLHADATSLAPLGLKPIYSEAPKPPEAVNWLNLFYALEWLIFAGFAVYFWVRLCRDAHEKEHEIIALKAAAESTPAPAPTPQQPEKRNPDAA